MHGENNIKYLSRSYVIRRDLVKVRACEVCRVEWCCVVNVGMCTVWIAQHLFLNYSEKKVFPSLWVLLLRRHCEPAVRTAVHTSSAHILCTMTFWLRIVAWVWCVLLCVCTLHIPAKLINLFTVANIQHLLSTTPTFPISNLRTDGQARPPI
jgi:hypothetical protein